MKAIIVDDEQRARDVLSQMLKEFCPDVNVVDLCKDVPSAVISINKHQPDVVFLDIEMPGYSGFQLFSFFQEINFEVIFATAYNQYAIKAFEVSAIDYLLKPIDIDKLEAAVEKVRNSMGNNNVQNRLDNLQVNMENKTISRVALPVSDGLVFIEIDTILAVVADGAYTTVSLSSGKQLFISKNIRYFDDLLGDFKQFFRVHRSSIANINCVERYSRNESVLVMDNNDVIKVARGKKIEFEEYIADYKL
jgi:two-component system, LytTR family, response regulator